MILAASSEMPTPALVVDRAVLERNIADMARRMRDLGVALRPHWKTSKMVEAAHLQHQAGCVGFTCATPAEVDCLLEHGYTDLTWAHQPVGPSKVAFAVEANRRGTVRVALDSVEAAAPLSRAAVVAGVAVPYLIEVDTGLGRAGVAPDQVLELAGRMAGLAGLEFEGIITHAGHLSGFGSRPLEASWHEGLAVGRTMVGIAQALREAGFPGDGGFGRVHARFHLHTHGVGNNRGPTRELMYSTMPTRSPWGAPTCRAARSPWPPGW